MIFLGGIRLFGFILLGVTFTLFVLQTIYNNIGPWTKYRKLNNYLKKNKFTIENAKPYIKDFAISFNKKLPTKWKLENNKVVSSEKNNIYIDNPPKKFDTVYKDFKEYLYFKGYPIENETILNILINEEVESYRAKKFSESMDKTLKNKGCNLENAFKSFSEKLTLKKIDNSEEFKYFNKFFYNYVVNKPQLYLELESKISKNKDPFEYIIENTEKHYNSISKEKRIEKFEEVLKRKAPHWEFPDYATIINHREFPNNVTDLY